MARKSRKVNFVNVGSEAPAAQAEDTSAMSISHAALYARLSFESDKNRERNTIETQMALLHSFADEQKDIVVEKEYFDISKTGTNFEREGFDGMMQDIKKGIIDCVIVKDLSRLGRNYVEAGSYIERVFPFFGVRFISVNDHYDSSRDDVGLLVGMSNIYNEFYSRDLAKKIRSSFHSSWENGEFPAGIPAYGYERGMEDPHRLVPDPVAAPVVKEIFRMFTEGETYAEIARTLDKKGYLCPRAYKRKKAGRELAGASEWKWQGSTVIKILENQYYVGDSIHNQYKHDVWAAKRQEPNPKEEWIVMENTHEALVSREMFDRTQKMMSEKRTKRRQTDHKSVYSVSNFNFFKGKIVCADCGKTMYLRGKADGDKRYDCGSFVLKRKCSSHSVRDTDLNDYVLRVIRTHINVYTKNVDMIQRLNQRQENIQKYDVFNREIRKCRKDLEKLAGHREQLFEDYVCRLIDAEQYEAFAARDAETEREIKQNLDSLLKHKVGYEKNFHTEEEWAKKIDRYRNTRTLTKGMVDAFVDKVEVSANGSIAVHLVYDDMLEELRRYAKEREEAL